MHRETTSKDRIGLAATLLWLAAAMPTSAEEHIPAVTPYRPTVSNPADLSEPGWLEMEFGWQRINNGNDPRRDSWPVIAKLAFNENWGVLLGTELGIRRTDSDGLFYAGMGDATVLLKHRIPSSREGAAWGIEAGFVQPTAKDALGNGKTNYLVNGIYSIDLPPNYHLDLNLNTTRTSAINPGEGRNQFGWAASLSRNLDDRWGLIGELSGNYRHGTATNSQALFAINYNYSKRLVLDAGVARGLASASPDSTLFFGLSILLGRIW